MAQVLDGPVNRRLIHASFADDPARVLGLALPLGLGQFGQSLFEDQAILLGELFDVVEDFAHGLAHLEASSRLGWGIITPGVPD
jgi:hypothetical protein